MLPTRSSEYRCFVPMYIILLAMDCNMFCGVIGRLEAKTQKIVQGLLLAFVVVVVAFAAYTLPHYFYNYQIELGNKRHINDAKHKGELYYCMDYDEDYTHTKAYNDGYFYSKYLETTKLSPLPERIYLYSKSLPIVYVDNVRATSPAVMDLSGQ